jgi:hypothetical protein
LCLLSSLYLKPVYKFEFEATFLELPLYRISARDSGGPVESIGRSFRPTLWRCRLAGHGVQILCTRAQHVVYVVVRGSAVRVPSSPLVSRHPSSSVWEASRTMSPDGPALRRLIRVSGAKVYGEQVAHRRRRLCPSLWQRLLPLSSSSSSSLDALSLAAAARGTAARAAAAAAATATYGALTATAGIACSAAPTTAAAFATSSSVEAAVVKNGVELVACRQRRHS